VELSQNLGNVKSVDSGLSLRSDNLESGGELYTEDDFRQLVVAVEVTPTFLGGLGELAMSRLMLKSAKRASLIENLRSLCGLGKMRVR
jgi:hypothetical protein